MRDNTNDIQNKSSDELRGRLNVVSSQIDRIADEFFSRDFVTDEYKADVLERVQSLHTILKAIESELATRGEQS